MSHRDDNPHLRGQSFRSCRERDESNSRHRYHRPSMEPNNPNRRQSYSRQTNAGTIAKTEKSMRERSKSVHESNPFSDVPRETEDVWERIEKWRRDGARCLDQKRQEEERLRIGSRSESSRTPPPPPPIVPEESTQRRQTTGGHVDFAPFPSSVGTRRHRRQPETPSTSTRYAETDGEHVRSRGTEEGGPSTSMSLDPARPKSIKSSNHVWDFSMLRIRNLPLSLTLNDMKGLFSQAIWVTIPMKELRDGAESESKESLGQVQPPVNPTALVKFKRWEEAEEALYRFEGLKVRGQKLEVSIEQGYSRT